MRTTIYLPDDLREQARAANLNVSAVCQEALAARLEHSDAHSQLVYELTATARELLGARSHIRNLEADNVRLRAAIEGMLLLRGQQSEGIRSDELAKRREFIRERGLGSVAQ